MSIIIRLQNLPLSAKASDIRDFFSNLKIPKGAVNIVGGNEGDAFIGFATDEDARLAMRFEGKLLHNAQVKLLLSSKTEMDSVIASAHAMAKAESFSAGASIAASSNLPVSAAHTKPFAADVSTPEGLKKDVKTAPFSFGLPASIAQISDHPSLAPQNFSSTGEFGSGSNWNSHPQPVASQVPPSDVGRVSTGLPSDSWKTSSSSYPAFQASFLPSSYNGPPPSQQQSTEQSKLFYSNNNNKAGMENQMYQHQQQQQQQQHQQPGSNIPTPNAFATAVIHNQQQQQQPQQQQQHPPPFVATQSIPSFPPNTNNHPFPSSTNNPPFSPSFVQHNPYSRDETRANTHSYQQHFDTPGARQTGPPAFAHSQYPLSPQEQARNGGMGSGPPKTEPFPQHTYEQQQQQQTSTFSQQAPPKVADNALWMPTNNQVVTEQKQFRNMGNDNGPFGQTSSKPPPSPTTNVYVELSRLPTELLRPANLEAFLSPTVPLTLSSVKVVHNPDGSVMHALVKFGCEEDAKRILHRNGDKGIKISPSSETSFNNAMDGILGAAAKPMVTSNKRSSPPTFPNNSSNQHGSNHSNSSDHQAKRGRRDAPGVWQSANDNDSDHRHRQQPDNKDRDRPAFNQTVRGNQPSSKKERVCVQLTNVPYKATYDNIRDFVCSGKSARYEKITRTYYAGKNLSDRWIIEFSNEKDASSVYKSRAEILGRRIHCEYLNPRAADDQYAIPEPDENRDRGGQQQQHHRNAPFQQQRGPPRPAPVHPGHSQRQNRSPNTIPCDANRVELQQPRKKDCYSDIPNMTLEASTLDELITRGDLPPTSFGAFQSAVAPSVGVLRKTGFTSKLGVGNQFSNNAGPNPASFNPPAHTTTSNNSNILPRGADYQAGFPHGSSHPPFVPPPSNLSRSVPTWPGAAPGQKQARQSPPRDPLQNFEFPKFRPKPQIHDPAPKNGLLPHPSNSSHPNDTGEEESPVPLFSIKFQNGPAEKADLRKQSANSLDCTLNSTCDTENGRLMIADDSAMSSASGLSIAASTASSSMEKMNPYICFLDRARENGEERTAIRLENVQKLVIAEKLCQFLGVQLVSPSENIARMPDGSLYVNLSNEDWASKAASRNGAFLERNKIFIQQISKSQMAEAIRRNLLNAPKPSEHALVARGFDRSTTANQVAQFFEKFHPLTVSLLPADKTRDKEAASSFVVTFNDPQECGAALMILNNTKLGSRVISLQMGPVNN